jgi:ubiquinone/menaquinone biosynthesis C-methylase UbiE
MEPRETVRRGYDLVAETYETKCARKNSSLRAEWLAKLASMLPKEAEILDLGCGSGIAASHLVAAGPRVIGVDISSVQIERARALVPDAEFIRRDMSELEFPADRFSAIVALYSIIHVPLAEQPGLFRRIAEWLRPGGYLLAILGEQAWIGTEENWLGVASATMYWSHGDAETYRGWLREVGFVILEDQFVPEEGGGHRLFLTQVRK